MLTTMFGIAGGLVVGFVVGMHRAERHGAKAALKVRSLAQDIEALSPRIRKTKTVRDRDDAADIATTLADRLRSSVARWR